MPPALWTTGPDPLAQESFANRDPRPITRSPALYREDRDGFVGQRGTAAPLLPIAPRPPPPPRGIRSLAGAGPAAAPAAPPRPRKSGGALCDI